MANESKKYKIGNYTFSVLPFTIMGNGKIENQDSYKIYFDDEQLIVVVADGLGSAAYSKEGSNKIVEVATEVLAETNDYDCVPSLILQKWKDGIVGNLNQYDTTIKFIKIKSEKIVFGGVGDGWIAINNKDDFISLTADNTFSNQTDSILSFDLSKKFVIGEAELISEFDALISTDGFSEDMDKPNGDEMLRQIHDEVILDETKFINEMSETLENWPVETNKDDKTVVFIVCKEE